MTNHPNRANIAAVTSGYEQIGDECYLTRRVDLNNNTTSYHVSRAPGRTNMTHEQREDGWLGTTNNVAVYAEGRVILTAWVGDEGKVRFRRPTRAVR